MRGGATLATAMFACDGNDCENVNDENANPNIPKIEPVSKDAPVDVLPAMTLLKLKQSCCLWTEQRGNSLVVVNRLSMLQLAQLFTSRSIQVKQLNKCLEATHEVLPGWFALSVLLDAVPQLGGPDVTRADRFKLETWLRTVCRPVPHRPPLSRGVPPFSSRANNVDDGIGSAEDSQHSGRSRSPASQRSHVSSCPCSAETLSTKASETILRQQQLQISLLQKLAQELQNDCSSKDQKLRQCKQQLKRSEDKNIWLQEQLDEVKAKKMKRLAIERHEDKRAAQAGQPVTEGESSGWLTPEGCISLAIQRNLSNIATADIGLTLMVTLSRWTVARAEVRTGACLIASSRLFWQCGSRNWQTQSQAPLP